MLPTTRQRTPTLRTTSLRYRPGLAASGLLILLACGDSTPSAPTDIVASVEIDPPAPLLVVGASTLLTATPRDAGGGELSGKTVSWTSDADSVATVSAVGEVSAVGVGQATLTAMVEGQSATTLVRVFEDVSGTYSATLTGVDSGVTLTADFVLTLIQDAVLLSGSFAFAGVLDDGSSQSPASVAGTLEGSVSPGADPPVGFYLNGPCPTRTGSVRGDFASATGVLTLSGDIRLFDGGCSVAYSAPSTLVLTR